MRMADGTSPGYAPCEGSGRERLRSGVQRIRRLTLVLLAGIAVWVSHAMPAAALDYPNRTVRVVIPFSAGGAPDIVMRILAQSLSEKWRQPVVVENRAGANTFIGTTAVTHSPADGYTLLFTADGTFILNPLLFASMPYAMSELELVTLVATTPHMLVVSNKVPAHTQADFVALARSKPGALNYGSTGESSIQRLAFEFFSRLAGISLVHVPYRGANETATALVSGEIDSSINGLATVYPHVLGGRMRGLSISTKQRSTLAPDLPTVQEAGVPGYFSQGAFGMLAPAGVPKDVVAKISEDIAEIVRTPEFRKAAAARYFEIPPTGPDEFRKLVAEETQKWRQVISEKNIKGE
jgi:tripartite-type tricarboxylate transporter receptor subunit TctC